MVAQDSNLAGSTSIPPLNVNFESGTLEGWTATGTAFSSQPVRGDTVSIRRTDMKSEHVGQFWVGGYEKLSSDRHTGILTSTAFKASQPWASFLVGGGETPKTRVEIVCDDDKTVIHTVSGTQQENMKRSVVDLRKYAGRPIFIRLIDEHQGHWGHINFDDFVFHSGEPKLAASEKITPTLASDKVTRSFLKPSEVPDAAQVPDGYELKVFAAEPDIINPIAFTLDDRGRIWVVGAMTYPTRAKDGEGKDRIIIFEDSDGDHRFDKRTVFLENLNLVSGIEVGSGGVWIGAAPNLYFVAVNDWDKPKASAEPRIVLDGWGFQDTHETLNTFRWGHGGWLYGCHGVFTHSSVGNSALRTKSLKYSQQARVIHGVWTGMQTAK
jgi:hypothetical protein